MMKFQFRGSLKNTREVVDIIEFNNRTAKCGDLKDRDIDEFNAIFYSSQKFKEDVLNVSDEAVETVAKSQVKAKTNK